MKGPKSADLKSIACEANIVEYMHVMVHFYLLPIFFGNNVRAAELARIPCNVHAENISVVEK